MRNSFKHRFASVGKRGLWWGCSLAVAVMLLAIGTQFPKTETKATAAPVPPAVLELPPSGWPMFGGTRSRNMVAKSAPQLLFFDQAIKDRRVLWKAPLGSQTYSSPVVSDGKVFIGTNNDGKFRPRHQEDAGVLLCFDAATGKLLWQLTRKKLPVGRVSDWPNQGIPASACVVGSRVWLVTNRAEVVCLDVEGFYDGENDGPYRKETDREHKDADIVWIYDMMKEDGVSPHCISTCSVLTYRNRVHVNTGNGVGEAHLEPVSPKAPSFLTLDAKTGKAIWKDANSSKDVLHGQWGSPSLGIVRGQPQLYQAGGNGWLYAFDPGSGRLLWKFDLNPKDSKWKLGGRGTRN
ncbi:MAG: PQQ-like beta-propeller repeat protein, partial [Planctomycetales bacterium]